MNESFVGGSFALGTAAFAGSGDFAGGVATKRAGPFHVVAIGHASGLILLAAIILVLSPPVPSRAELGIAAVAGLVGALATAALFYALARGAMGLASPMSALVGALLPIMFAIATLGPPGPVTLTGFAVALAGVVLVNPLSRTLGPRGPLFFATLAGVGFGLFLVLLKLASTSPLYAVAVGRAASTLCMTALAVARPKRWPEGRGIAFAVVAGSLDTFANVCFALAVHYVRIDVAATLYSLYPAFTVGLAYLVLHERVRGAQRWGVLLMLVSLPLLARGG